MGEEKSSQYQIETSEAGIFRPDLVLGINPQIALRIDKEYIFAFRNGQPQSRPLDQRVAILLALFNGRKTNAEVKKQFEEINSKKELSCHDFETIMKKLIQPLFKDWPLSLVEVTPKTQRVIKSYNPLDFAFKQKMYSPKNHKFDFPTFLGIHLTNRCETNCVYCYADNRYIPPQNHLSVTRWKELIDEAARNGVLQVSISGGDPLCYPGFLEVLNHIIDSKIYVDLVSTKAYIDPETANGLVALEDCLEGIQISLDAHEAQLCDYIVGRKGAFDRMIRSIDYLKKAGSKKIILKSIITSYNEKYIPEIVRFLDSFEPMEIRLCPYGRSIYRHKDELFSDPDNFRRMKDSILAHISDIRSPLIFQDDDPSIDVPSIEERKQKWRENRVACTAGKSQMTILGDGKVIACEQIPQREDLFLGDVSKKSLKEIWNSRRLDELTWKMPKEKYRGTVCFKCAEFDECHLEYGYCFMEALRQYGKFYFPPPDCPQAPEPKRKS